VRVTGGLMKVELPGIMLRFVEFESEIDIAADTVSGALTALVNRYPGLRGSLVDGEGKVRKAHQLFVDGEQIKEAEFDLPVKQAATLVVITAIAGG